MNINILVVDDDPFLRELYVEFLSRVGYEVDAKASGEEALEAVSHRSYDLMILDLVMTGINGLATFQQVKLMTPDAKAVLVSGSVDQFEAELEEARRNGLLGVLPKPFALQDLSKLVESALQGEMRVA